MPHKRAGTKADFVTRLLQTPAEVHVVSSTPEYGIELSNFGEGPLVESHVAPGNVLRLSIREHNMRWPSGRCHHRGRHSRIFGWQKIRSSNAGIFTGREFACQIIQPVLIRTAVRISESHDFALR